MFEALPAERSRNLALVRSTGLGLVALCLSALACSDPASPSNSGGQGGGGGTGGFGGSGGSTGTPGALQAAELLPLANGNSWTYDVTITAAGSFCQSGTRSVAATGPQAYQSKQAFAVDDVCDQAVYTATEGGDVYEWNGGFWAKSLPSPVQEGYTWVTDGVGDYSWKMQGSVTTPAGVFSDCWLRDASDALTADKTYCKGVGLVRWDQPGRTQVLTASSLK
jgi:hypothetical protein